MGKYLNANIEYRREQESGLQEYDLYGNVVFGRDYCLFGLLAGVRGQQKLYETRGFPEDACWILAEDFRNNSDAYSPSWLEIGELSVLLDHYAEVVAPLPESTELALRATIAAMEILNAGDPSRSRLVFWFD